MSAIFISHSSKDNASAEDLANWLKENGHRSLFLDFDPANGIPAGRNWERELYQQLRACQAVIVLCSPDCMASKWCFVEIAHARTLGKALFPVVLTPCELPPSLSESQAIDLTGNQQEGYQRLWRGLLKAGLDPAKAFDWDGNRPPYPGLLAFDEADAAIFFGRDEHIQEGLETLNHLQRLGGDSLVLFLGASGSGKSSLVRAGLVPRLKQEGSDRWLVLDPFRPRQHPVDELAESLNQLFALLGAPRDRVTIRNDLHQAAEQDPPDSNVLLELVDDLRFTSGHRAATTLIVIDQFEELLVSDPSQQVRRFLPLLKAALNAANGQLLALATMRSDFLGAFQNHPSLHGLPFKDIPVPPLTVNDFAQIIEKPARLAGLDLEDGLVQAMVADTGTRDALPLLAFTLRRLWDRYHHDGRLTLEAYRVKLGGLEGSVAGAAEEALGNKRLTGEQETVLRRAFSQMVRVNAEGQYARRTVSWHGLPEDSHPLLEGFVQARLLVSNREHDERVLEVAHEALFRTWQRLKLWLDRDREFLLWRQRLQADLTEWERSEQDPGSFLRGARLAEAARWARQRADDLTGREQAFVQHSLALKEREDEEEKARQRRELEQAQALATEQQRRAEEQSRAATRFRLLSSGLAVVFLVAAGAAFIAWEKQQEAETQGKHAEQQRQLAVVQREHAEANGRVALARQLAAESAVHLRSTPPRSLLLAVEATRATRNRDGIVTSAADAALRRALAATGSTPLLDHHEAIVSVAMSADGRRLGAGTEAGKVTLWERRDADTEPVIMAHYDGTAIAMSADGQRLATGNVDGTVKMWDLGGVETEPRNLTGHEGAVKAVALSPDGRWLATGGPYATLRLWDLNDPRAAPRVLRGKLKQEVIGEWYYIETIAFSGDGRWLAAGGQDSKVRLWDMTDIEAEPEILAGHENVVSAVAFGGQGRWLASGSDDFTLRIWDRNDLGKAPLVLGEHESYVEAVAFSADGRWFASSSRDKTVRLWVAGHFRDGARVLRAHEADVNAVALSADGRWLVSGSKDHTVRLWDLSGAEAEPRPLRNGGSSASSILVVAFDETGSTLLAGSDNALWRWRLGEADAVPLALQNLGYPSAAALSRDRRWFAFGESNKLFLRDLHDPHHTARQLRVCEDYVEAVAVSATGRWLACRTLDSAAVQLWDSHDPTGKPRALPASAQGGRAIAFSPDDRWLGVGSYDDRVQLWNLGNLGAGPRELLLETTAEGAPQAMAVAFSPDGRWLAGGRDDGRVQLWALADTHSAVADRVLHGHADAISALAFSEDGRWLASGGDDTTVRLWDLDNPAAESRVLSDLKSSVNALAFSPDGTRLAAGDKYSDSVLIWRVKEADLMFLACRRAGRNLAEAEWARYFPQALAYRKTCPDLPVPAAMPTDGAEDDMAAGLTDAGRVVH